MGTIREYKRGDGTSSFHAEVRLRGYPPQRGSFRNKTLAKKWIQDTESSIRDGRHFRTAESKKHTLGELIDRFIDQWLPRNPNNLAKKIALLTWWKDELGHTLLADLTPALIAEARDKLLSETTVRKSIRSPSTVNRYLAALSKALTIAMKEWGWIDDSPMRKVTKPPEAKGRDRLLTLEEKDRLLIACRASSNPYLYPIVSLALLTGMRYSEITGLRWEDIDFPNKTITLQAKKQFHFGVYGVIEIESQLLVVHKSRGPYKGLFDLPGGRPEHGENVKETLKREISEETGIKIRDFSFLDDFSFVSNYRDLRGNDIELHHVGLIYFIHSIDRTKYSPSIFSEDVKGSSWIDKGLITPKNCSPLLMKALSV